MFLKFAPMSKFKLLTINNKIYFQNLFTYQVSNELQWL